MAGMLALRFQGVRNRLATDMIFRMPLRPQPHHCISGRAGRDRAKHPLTGRRHDVNCLLAISWCLGRILSCGGAILHDGPHLAWL